MHDEDNNELDDLILDEGTEAANTLKPSGAPGDSKAEVLATFTSLLSQLGKEDLSNLYNQTVNQHSALLSKIADNSEQNKNTVDMKGPSVRKAAEPMPKLSVKEDIDELFGTEELTEDFKTRAEVIFEAALNTRILIEEERLREEYESKLGEAIEELEEKFEESTQEQLETMTEQLDKYLDYVVKTWMEANEVAIESNTKSEIAEDFMIGLRNLFLEHNVDLPEEKIDVVNEIRSANEALRSELEEAREELISLKNIVEAADRAAIVNEMSEDLTLVDSERLRLLSEGVEISDRETFRKKMGIIKESLFTNKKTKSTGLLTEEIDGVVPEKASSSNVDPVMSAYTKALSRTSKV